MFRSLIGAAFLVVCTLSHAGSWITADNTAKITQIQHEGGIVKVTFSSVDKVQSTDGCIVQGQAVLQDDTKNGDRQYAALLTAYSSGKTVMMFGSGCWGGWNTTFPKIYSVILTD